ncbi:Uncharacterized protein DBV15_09356 [Temnothorax longispinosus]|uniref:Uncharacterized protein n=1 Tax=Temnothorax longispinosus TaxID=300112 RepID=A0A4V3SCA4_9HYME|nr:Uncharacterized protein DBV15_09356 [Temnothorax longispinosus]
MRSADYHKTTGRTDYLNCRPVNTSNINGKSRIHFSVRSRAEWEWGSIKRQLATAAVPAIATAVIAGERDPRDDRFLNKNRQPDRSSRTDTGPHHSPSVQSEAPIALMYSNLTSLYEMAKMQHNDANNDHQGLHISPLKEPAGLVGNLSEFELQFRGVWQF